MSWNRRRIVIVMSGIGASITLLSGCAHSTFSIPPERMFEAEFPATWVEQMSFAYSDFRKTVSDPGCFDLLTRREADLLIIDFVPEEGVRMDGDAIQIPMGNSSECGDGITYEFNSDGSFLKKYYTR